MNRVRLNLCFSVIFNFYLCPSSGGQQRGGGGGGGGGMGRGRGRRDNELIGQTVRISQGPYKGNCLQL